MSDWNEKVIAEFRENNGVVGGPFAGRHLLLLTTTGAKTGEKRVSPVVYVRDGERKIVVASKGGHPKHPSWYHNLMANPTVHVEASVDGGIEEYDALAAALPESERAVKYAEIVVTQPQFGEYQQKTERTIPLVALTRVSP